VFQGPLKGQWARYHKCCKADFESDLRELGMSAVESRKLVESTFETIEENAASPSTGSKHRRIQLLTPPPKTPQSYADIVDCLTFEASPVPKLNFQKESNKSAQKTKKASFRRPIKKRKQTPPASEPSKKSKVSWDGTDSGVAADSEVAEETQVLADDSFDAEVDIGTEHDTEPADQGDIMSWSVFQRAVELNLPQEAMPQEIGKGKANYTISGPSGCRVEVHLHNQGFYLKRGGDGGVEFGCSRNIAWKKSGGVTEAWEIVKDKIGWDTPATAMLSE
jgi:hypothetical protein